MTEFKLNLQLFADPNGAELSYAAASSIDKTTTGNLSPEMKKFYSKELLEEVGPNLVHAQFGEKVYIPKGNDRKIEWRKFSKFAKALKPLEEGVTPVPSTLKVDTVTKRLEQFGDYSYISDLLDLTAIDPVIVEYTKRHAENASLTLDTIVRNDLQTGTNVYYAGGAASRSALATAGTKLSVEDVAKAATILKKVNAPKIDGSYVAIIHPSVAYDIMRDQEWKQVHEYSGDVSNIYQGEIGSLYGVRFVESTEAMVYKDTTASYTLTGGTYDASTYTLTCPEGTTLTANELAGKVMSLTATNDDVTTVENVAIVSNTTSTITFADSLHVTTGFTTLANLNSAANAVYGCLFLGKGAYKVVDVNGQNMEMIVKSTAEVGGPLEQRSSVGWKCNAYGAAIVLPDYILRVECCSTFSDVDGAN